LTQLSRTRQTWGLKILGHTEPRKGVQPSDEQRVAWGRLLDNAEREENA
jgi:hypothetical protein